jgi:hypothetical protein
VIQVANLHVIRNIDIQPGRVGDYEFFIVISERWALGAEASKRSKKNLFFLFATH